MLVEDLTILTVFGFMYEKAKKVQLIALTKDVINHVVPVPRTRVIFDQKKNVVGYVSGESTMSPRGTLYNLHAAMINPKYEGMRLIRSAMTHELDETYSEALAFQTGSRRMFNLGLKFANHENQLAMEFGPYIGTAKPMISDIGGVEMVVEKERYPKRGLYLDRKRFEKAGNAIRGLPLDYAILFGGMRH